MSVPPRAPGAARVVTSISLGASFALARLRGRVGLLFIDAPHSTSDVLSPQGHHAHGRVGAESLTLFSSSSLSVLIIIGVSCGVVSALVSCAVRLPRPRAQPETAPL